ncbi:hypothetical protein BST97_05850 [Nonlabens spongiae]|uniref:Uncharacterized protein n=1 Tax=Nonlabens spongiae TaxID=331648 RepID=A0A1W6MIV6_9FLAO|nr:hypothetical protein [Nonlabens spongiae]ARN77548.1 hypothetical protein BST97_05850 [Nonlabens spongiae]
MDQFTLMILWIYGAAIAVTIFVIVLDRMGKTWTQYLIRIITSIAVVWALCTSWMWFYLIALWLSLPAFLIGLVLTIYTINKYGWGRPAKVFSIVIGLTVILNLVSLAFFYS